MMSKICTNVEQSNKLIELGIDVNTADMCYHFIEINKTPLCIRCEKVHDDEKDNSVPAWSLAALLSAADFNTVNLSYNDTRMDWVASATILDSVKQYPIYKSARALNPIDACVAMIEKLHELKML